MGESTDSTEGSHHHSLRERLDAARAAAEEVVAEESGQLGGELSALAVPFEQVVAAVNAAIHPHRLANSEDGTGDPGPGPREGDSGGPAAEQTPAAGVPPPSGPA